MTTLTKAQREVLASIASGEFVHFVGEHRKTGVMVLVFGNADHRFKDTTVNAVRKLGLIQYEMPNKYSLTDAGRAALEAQS